MARALITGASGLLGANLAAALVAAGHEVRATRRGSTRVDHLADLPITWVAGDLASVPELTAACHGVDVVFHCAAEVGVERVVTPALHAGNVVGAAHVVEAVIAAGAPRLVHTSSTVAVGLSEDGRPCDEDTRWNFGAHGLADGYAITKRQGEERVLAAADRLDVVVVNPGYMFGPRDVRPSSGKLIVDVVAGRVPGWTTGLNNFVDVRAVALGMIGAWQRGQRGRRYILGGDNLTYREVMQHIAAVAGVRPPRWPAPRPLVRALGWWGDRVEDRGGRAVLNSAKAGFAFARGFQFSSARAIAELGYQPGPLEPAIADALAWFRARAMV